MEEKGETGFILVEEGFGMIISGAMGAMAVVVDVDLSDMSMEYEVNTQAAEAGVQQDAAEKAISKEDQEEGVTV